MRLIPPLWDILRSPFLLIGLALVLGSLLLLSLQLPQLPGQLVNDPAESARWLAAAQEQAGPLGVIYHALGLFQLSSSLVPRLVLGGLTLLALIQVGDLLLVWLRMRSLPALLAQKPTGLGDPLPVPGSQPIQRWRGVAAMPLGQIRGRVEARLEPKAAGVWLHSRQPVAPSADLRDAFPELFPPEVEEERFLWRGDLPALPLRLLGGMGLLLLLALTWLSLTLSWEVRPPLLVPFDQFRDPTHELALLYQLPSGEEAGEEPVLTARVGERSGRLPVDQPATLELGSVTLQSTPEGVALVAESWAAQGEERTPALSVPGGPATNRLSFAFPTVGGEEFLLVSGAQTGLRIVRLPEAGRFLVEIYQGEASQPVERFEMRDDESRSLTLGQGPGQVVVRFFFLPTLSVQVRHLPLGWLFWLTLPLIGLGAAGFVRRPSFLLVQAAPWPPDQTLLLAQASHPALLEAVQALVNQEGGEEPPPAPASSPSAPPGGVA